MFSFLRLVTHRPGGSRRRPHVKQSHVLFWMSARVCKGCVRTPSRGRRPSPLQALRGLFGVGLHAISLAGRRRAFQTRPAGKCSNNYPI
jgi:hypothetical protein